MRRWNLLFLGALVAVLAAVLITPSRAMAAPSSPTSFKGKVVAKNTSDHYFVVSFTCLPPMSTSTQFGTLMGSWTYEVTSAQSITGTLGSPVVGGCALVPTSANGVMTWSTSSDGTTVSPFETDLNVPAPPPGGTKLVGTLTLFLTGIGTTKTFLASTTNVTCSSNSPTSRCIQVDTSGLMSSLGVPKDFFSEDPIYFSSYATLNLTLPNP